jgi:hypothetical protein
MPAGAEPSQQALDGHTRVDASAPAKTTLALESIKDPTAGVNAPPTATPVVAKLVSPAKEKSLREYLPKVTDAAIQRVLDDPNLIIYTEEEMPRAYQFWNGANQGVHSAYYNISANGGEPFGNANREFPWGTPAGTHRTKNVRSFRFLLLPRDTEGKVLPVVWYRKQLRGDGQAAYAWTFPIGTVLGEVLSMRSPDGKDYTFEMRIRTRERGDWDVNLFRPFPTAIELSERIKALRPTWADNKQLAEAVAHLEQPLTMTAHTLVDKHPGKRSFQQAMGVDSLPPLGDDALVTELLTTTRFRSALGEAWRKAEGNVKTFAPTTTAAYHVIPANFDAGFIEVDRTSCIRCHESVNESVNAFDGGRDWYGRVRGSDGIFSFHPFAPSSVSGNGYSVGVRMRGELEQAGLIARYDPAKHPATIYHALEDIPQR